MHVTGSGGSSIVASGTIAAVMRGFSKRQIDNAELGAGQHSNPDKRVQSKRKQRRWAGGDTVKTIFYLD